MGIKDIVTREVFSLFTEGKFEEGRDILKNLSFRLDECVDTEEKRLILYNLNVVSNILSEKQQAKFYIKMIKNIIEQDEEYIKNNTSKYCDVLVNYSNSFADDISKKEKIDIYTKSYESCNRDLNLLDRSLNALNNICLLEEDYEGCIDILVDIHNYSTFSNLSKELCGKLEVVKNEIINDLDKLEDRRWYDEAKMTIEELLNKSNTCEMQG